MAAPTFVQEAETAFNSSTTPKSTSAFSTLTGDILVSLGIAGDGNTTAVTPTLTGETFTSQENLGTSGASSRVHAFTAVIASGGVSETVSVARSGNVNFFGANVLTFRGSDGVGAAESAQIAAGTTASTLAITTTQDNSAIAVAVADWNAGSGVGRTWRTVNGSAPTELTFFSDGSNYGVYIAYYADAGSAGAQTVGLTVPTMRWTIAAIEIKGTAGASPVIPPLVMAPSIPT